MMTGAENAGGHVAPLPSQTLGSRPVWRCGNYATPIDGIFLTGAGTHPGSSVSGAPGRACADAVLRALGPTRGRLTHGARVAGKVVAAVRTAREVGRDLRR